MGGDVGLQGWRGGAGLGEAGEGQIEKVVFVLVEAGRVEGGGDQFRVAEAGGEEGEGPGTDGFQDADAEEFVVRGADDQVGLLHQVDVGGPVGQIAPMHDVIRQTLAGGLEFHGLVAKALPGHGQAEGDAGRGQPVHQVEEAVRAFVIFPTLVPQDQGRRARLFGAGIELCALDPHGQHLAAGRHLLDQGEMVVIGKVFEQPGHCVKPIVQMIAAVEDHPIRGHLAQPVDQGIGQIRLFAGAGRIGELVFVHIEKDRGASQGHVPHKAQKGGQVDHIRGQDGVRRAAFLKLPPGLGGQFQGTALHPPLPKAPGHAQDLHLMTAAPSNPLGPSPMAARMIGREQPDLFGSVVGWGDGLGGHRVDHDISVSGR